MERNKAAEIKNYGGWVTFARKSAPYVFIAPFFISFCIFSIYPICYSFYLSLVKWNGSAGVKMIFVGFRNYYNLLMKDSLFWKSLLNTMVMAVIVTIPQHSFALFFAFILNQAIIRFKNFFKAILFMPYVTSTIAIGIVFGVIYGRTYGLLNWGLISLDKLSIFHNLFNTSLLNTSLPIYWIRDFCWWAISSIAVWQWTGWNAIIYFAGLQAIPNNLYEAARIDGAGWGQVFFNITLPLLRPIIFFATTLTIIGQIQFFNEPMILAGGVDGMSVLSNASMTLAVYLYAHAFKWGSFGTAAALSYIMFVFIIILTFINRRLLKEK